MTVGELIVELQKYEAETPVAVQERGAHPQAEVNVELDSDSHGDVVYIWSDHG